MSITSELSLLGLFYGTIKFMNFAKFLLVTEGRLRIWLKIMVTFNRRVWTFFPFVHFYIFQIVGAFEIVLKMYRYHQPISQTKMI